MGCCGESTRVDTARINGKILAPPGAEELMGPVKKRSCRDVVFLILFVAACIGGIIYLAVAGYQGNPQRLIHGYDPYGNICGQKNTKVGNVTQSGRDMTLRPFLDVTTVSVSSNLNSKLEGTCVQNCNANQTKIGYYCLPLENALPENPAVQEVLGSPFKKIGMNLAQSWQQIIIICLIGLALSIIFIVMLRFLAAIVVWLTIAVIVIGSVGGTIALWVYRHFEIQKLEEMKNNNNSNMDISIQESFVQNLLIAAIFATIFTVLILILLIAMRNRIRLVIQLFVEAGKAIASMPLLMIQPLWTMIIMSIAIGLWLLGWLLILSSGKPHTEDNVTVSYVLDPVIENMRWYHVLMFYWVTQFIIGCQHLTIAGAVSAWYFERDKSKLRSPILTAMKYLILYHLGSVALGSLIIAIIKLIQALLKFIENRFKSFVSGPGKWICCCVQCCMSIFEKFLKFITRNAYIEIAIYGHGFCKSAQMAFAIITSNALRVTAINFIGDFLLLLTKVAVVIATTFIGIEIMKNVSNVDNIWPAVVIGALFSFIISHCFVSVYEMTIDTLLVCFCEDCQRNDGIQKPYFMSKGLMKFVENSQEALNALEKRSRAPSAKAKQHQPMQVLALPVVAVDPSQLSPSSEVSMVDLNGAKTGMTPLHAPYKAVSEPPSPSKFLSPPE